MSMTGSMTYNNNSLKFLFSDKVFQFYYQKQYKSREYQEFLYLNDKEKVSFLADLYLYVSKKGGFIYDEGGFSSKWDNYTLGRIGQSGKEIDKFNNHHQFNNSNSQINFNISSQIPREMMEKLKLIKDENKKKEIMKKIQKLNNENKEEEDFTLNGSPSKQNLANILKKYSNPPKLNLTTDVNTLELQSMIINIENCIHNKNDDLENYIKEDGENENENDPDNDRIHSSTINKHMYDMNEDLYDKLNEAYSHIQIPTYQSSFYKADYNKSRKICLEQINELSSEYYLIDNREIFLVNYSVNEYDWIKSKNNGMNEGKSKEAKKRLIKPNKTTEVNSLSNVLFNKTSSNIFVNTLSKKNILKRDCMLISSSANKKKTLFEDLILINETITETSEMNVDKSKKKAYVGRDLIDRIYFCPMNNVIVLDYNDANKLGLMLLDYLRLENEKENLKIETENLINEINYRLEEESKKFDEEKQKFINEVTYLKEKDRRKLELVYEYVNLLRGKLEFTQKMINDNAPSTYADMDNSKIIETINKNLENLTKPNNNGEDFNDNSTTALDNPEHPSYDSQNHTLKSSDFYLRKKMNINSMNSSAKYSPPKK